MAEKTDAELVTLVREVGDTVAYGQLIKRYQGHAYGLAYSILGDWAEAQDMAQEAFIRAYVNLHTLDGPDRFPAWLRRIVFSTCIDWMRRFRPELYRSLGEIDGIEDLDRIPDTESTTAFEYVLSNEMSKVVLAAINDLPQKYRIPLTMFHLNGLSYKRVADFLEIPIGTVQSLISRARKRLKPALETYAQEVFPMIKEVLDEHKLPEEFVQETVKGLNLQRAFFEKCGKPLLRKKFPKEFEKLAAASVGFGSDRIGADDKFSRDHMWEPGFQIFSSHLDLEKLLSIEKVLHEELPWEFWGFKRSDTPRHVHGIRAWTIDEFFEFMTGFARPPKDDPAWLRILESDLLCATNGETFHDPTGELSKRRDAFKYYPDNVWKYRLGGRAWRIFVWRASAERTLAHREAISATMQITEGLREVMHFGFLINRQYAPWDRWLHWAFRRLPKLAPSVDPLITQIWNVHDCNEKLRLYAEIENCCAQHVYAEGLAIKPKHWFGILRNAVEGDLAKEPYSTLPFWIGTEFRYGGLSPYGGDIRKLFG